MEGLRPWHLALFALAGIAVVVSLVFSLGSDNTPTMSKRVVLVDVTSGELYEFSTRKRPSIIPERHPQSGVRVLYPARKDEAGKWFVEGRYINAVLEDKSLKPAALINPDTGELKTQGDSPKSAQFFVPKT